MFALMHSELSEMLEGVRKNLVDDHCPKFTSESIELADFIIRLLDYIGNRNIDIDYHISMRTQVLLQDNKASCINSMHDLLSKAHYYRDVEGEFLSRLFVTIEAYVEKFNIDLLTAIEAKRAYNRVREDHKDAARLAAGGKKF